MASKLAKTTQQLDQLVEKSSIHINIKGIDIIEVTVLLITLVLLFPLYLSPNTAENAKNFDVRFGVFTYVNSALVIIELYRHHSKASLFEALVAILIYPIYDAVIYLHLDVRTYAIVVVGLLVIYNMTGGISALVLAPKRFLGFVKAKAKLPKFSIPKMPKMPKVPAPPKGGNKPGAPKGDPTKQQSVTTSSVSDPSAPPKP